MSDVLDVLRVLDATPAPRGHELAAASALRDFVARRWPDVDWRVERYGRDGANVVAVRGPGPLLYSHLDTSLDGSPRDALVTGRSDEVGALSVADGAVSGFGLGVARAPAAAALVAFTGASAGTLLLAGSGTHRRGSSVTGLEAFLAEHPLPSRAIVAKSGPAAVLCAEPGASYLTVTVRGRAGVVLAPESSVPAGGVLAQSGVVLAALDEWRHAFVSSCPPGETGRAAGVGSLRGGWPDKPDLLPAALEIALYVVTAYGDEPEAIADDVRSRVAAACAASPLRECDVSVDLEVVHAAARTSPDAPIVRAAARAWRDEFGTDPQPVAGWTGSTDGVVLRGRGVDTVRLGPTVTGVADDPRREAVRLDVLESFVRIYRRLLDES